MPKPKKFDVPTKRFTTVIEESVFAQLEKLCEIEQVTPTDYINNLIRCDVKNNSALIEEYEKQLEVLRKKIKH